MLTSGKFSEKETLIKTLMASIGQGNEKCPSPKNGFLHLCISKRSGWVYLVLQVVNAFESIFCVQIKQIEEVC